MPQPRPALAIRHRSFAIQPRRRGGFTLVELLTVVAIIGVLAAILLAALGPLRKSARASADLATLRSLGQSMLQYAADNKGAINAWGRTPGQPGNIAHTFWGRAWPYLRNTQLTQLTSAAMREVAASYVPSAIKNDRPDLVANNDGIDYAIAFNSNLYSRDSEGFIIFTRLQTISRPSVVPYIAVGKWGFWNLSPAPLPDRQPSEGAYWPYAGDRTIAVHLDGSTAFRGESISAADLRSLSR